LNAVTPPELSGSRTGPLRLMGRKLRFAMTRRYACLMSFTTIAMCWNHRSVLVLPSGYRRPAESVNSRSSIRSRPSRSNERRPRACRTQSTPTSAGSMSPRCSTRHPKVLT
jgi:hypothetical protein